MHRGGSPEVGFLNLGLSNPAGLLSRKTTAIQQYGFEVRRRAYEIVWELQDQQGAPEASRAQAEVPAERKGAQANESHARHLTKHI